MPVTVNHVLTATTPDDPLYEIRPSHWNSSHAFTLNALGSEISNAFNNAGGVTFGLETNGSITASAPGGGAVTHNSTLHSGNIIPAAVQDFGNFALSLGTAAEPAASAGRLAFHGFLEQGKHRFGMVTPDGSHVTHAQDQFIIARNTSGSTINPGKAVYITGSTGSTPNISPAKADSTTTMPAVGITVDSIANNAFGRVMINGVADQLNTSAFTEGDRLWVSDSTAGDLTATEPTYPSLRQRVAVVVNAHAVQGKLLVLQSAARGEFGIQAISAGTTQATSGGVVLSNSNGISFGVNGNTVTASHNGLTTAAASDHSHGNPQLNLTNLSGTTASNSAGFTLSLSAGAGGAGDGGNILIAGTRTAGSNSSVLFSNLNGITFGLDAPAGSVMTASHNGLTTAALSNHSHGDPTLALTNLSGTTASNSAGFTLSLSAGVGGAGDGGNILAAGTRTAGSNSSVLFDNANGITFGLDAVNGSVMTASHNALTSQSGQALSGSNGSFAFQTATFGDSNGLSFYTTNGSLVGSYTVPAVPPETPFGISAGTQSVSTGTLVFSNSNGISFGMSGSSRITASYTVPTQTVQPVALSGSNGSFNFSTATFGNSNGLSFYTTNGSMVGSYTVPAPETPFGISAGTQSVSTGTLVFSNSNGISFGMSGSSRITASHDGLTSQSNQAASGQNGSFTFQTLSFSNANGISIGTSAGPALTFSHNALTSQSNQAFSAGAASSTFQTLSFQDSNGISFSNNAGGIRLTHGLAGTSTGFAGANISGSITNNSAGLNLSLSVAAPGAAAENNWFTLLGNVVGNSTASGSTIALSGGNNVTLSGTNGSQIVISAAAGGGAGTVDRYLRLPLLTAAASLQNNSSVSIFPFNLGGNLAFSNVRLAMSLSGATTTNTSSAGMAMSISFVLYTRNVSTLSSLASGSQTYSGFYQSNSVTQSFGGGRGFTVDLNGGATTLSPDEYWMAVHVSTATSGQTSLAKSISMGVLPSLAANFAGLDPFMSATANTRGAMVGLGVYSTGATRATIAFSNLTGQASNSATLANLWVDMRNWSVW